MSPSDNRSYIVHVDMDAFFASVEQRNNPKYEKKPVVVGADPKKGEGRGVVSACSYEARKYGIHSAMPVSVAYRKCPDAVFLPVNMDEYLKVSARLFKIFLNFTPRVEKLSIDEAFLDISGSFHLFGSPLRTCKILKEKIKKSLKLTSSVGLAPNKLAAKIASDILKPDGLVYVKNENLSGFLRPLDIGRLWGVGKKTLGILHEMNIRTFADLADKDVRELYNVFGKNGVNLWHLANGKDSREVESRQEIKSVSNEFTFPSNTAEREKIMGTFLTLCEKVSMRLRKKSLKARTVTMKIRLEGFNTYTRSYTMPKQTNYVEDIYGRIKDLYEEFSRCGKKVRLVGVKASNFDSEELDLFYGRKDVKEDIHKAVEKMQEKYGEGVIRRAACRSRLK